MEKGLKWISLILLLTFGLAIVNVASSPSAVVYVDPPAIRDDTMQSGSYFVVRVNISDVTDLFSWQVRMNFDNTVLNAIDCIQGDFLAGQPQGTIWMENIRNENGYILMGETSWSGDSGVDGYGWLGSVNFTVIGYGQTELDIDNYPATFLMDSTEPLPQEIPFDAENGFFSNIIPGDIQGDTSGTLPDGDVDMFDFFAFADHYATVASDPKYNILADLQGDTPGSYPYPDGDVDMFDFFAFADNYGRII